MQTIGDIEAFLLKINVWLIAVKKKNINKRSNDLRRYFLLPTSYFLLPTSYFLIPSYYNAWLLKNHVIIIILC